MESFGVLHSPSVTCLDLGPEDCCVVLATDGEKRLHRVPLPRPAHILSALHANVEHPRLRSTSSNCSHRSSLSPPPHTHKQEHLNTKLLW